MLPYTSALLATSLRFSQTKSISSERNYPPDFKFAEWPTHFEGSRLHPAKSSQLEKTIAGPFPGDIATFHSAGRRILLRRTTRGTRRLQASETYLRAEDYHIFERKIESQNWLAYFANKGEKTLHVREQITGGQKCWHSPASWFWHATLNPRGGPWLAVTVLTPMR